MYQQLLGNFFFPREVIAKKETAFKYTLVWSKLHNFVDTKFFIIITYKKVKQPQIRHRFYGHNTFRTVLLIEKHKVLKKK